MNISGAWPMPKTLRSCSASSSNPGAGLSWTATSTRLPAPSAASSLFSRSAAFTTLAGRNGPDGSWRDHSSNFTMFCARAGADAKIAEEAPARAAISSVTFAPFQCLIVVSLIFRHILTPYPWSGLYLLPLVSASYARKGARRTMAFSFLARESGRVHVCGHRGFSLHYPENTLPAFAAAKAWGATTIEIDVVLTAEGEPIVLHD